jgi:hypothetical protein
MPTAIQGKRCFPSSRFAVRWQRAQSQGILAGEPEMANIQDCQQMPEITVMS